MTIDNKPEEKDYDEYKYKLTPFRMQVLTNFPYIEKDFDALTDYGLLCKIVEYLNKNIDNMNTMEENLGIEEENIHALYDAYSELLDYINNYFENLDVQEEINNKLNEMAESGELTLLIKKYVDPIYQAYENEINNEINEQNGNIDNFKNNINNEFNSYKATINEDIESINNKVDKATSGAPKPVSSVSQMTDTSKIYVNTTDGNWYYYNGSTWVIGGVYQSTTLGNEEVDYLNIDKVLKSPYLVNYTPISLGQLTSGKYLIKNNNDILVFNDNAVWGYYEYDINQNDVNKILDYTVTNYNNQCGIFIVDEDNKVLHQSTYHQNNKFETVHGRVKITVDMKKIYMQRNLGPITTPTNNYAYNRINYTSINFISSLNPIVNYNEKSQLEAINEIEHGYIRYTNTVNTDNIPIVTYFNSNWSVKTYRIEKGNRYYVVGTNRGESTSYIITDSNYVAQEISSVDHEQDTLVSKDFVATFDGYIITTEVETGSTTEVYIYDSFKTDTLDFSDIKIGFTGDSICHGDGYLGGYARILNEEYNLQYQNIGVSGGHLANDKPSVPFVISESIDDLDNDCDAYIIEGGINDFVNQVPIGIITTNYTDTITNTTLIGALEKTFRDLYTYHAGKKFAFLIIHNVNDYYLTSNGANTTWKDYREAIYSVCKKYGIKVIDIGEESMNTYNNTVAQTYTAVNGDRLHPNKAGYEKFYVPQIKEWIINELYN